MPENTPDKQHKPDEPSAAQRGQAAATAAAEADKRQADETVPGGRYIVSGQVVDANGEPVEKAE